MNFDEVLKELGEFGKYQAIIFFLVCMPVIFCAAGTLAYIFSAGTPKYRCFVDGCDDESNPQFTADWLPNIIPAESNAGPYVPRSCDVYSFNSSVPTSNSSICYTDLTGSSIGRCDRWVYEYPEWTIVTQWDLTCPDKLWMLSLVGTINFSGVFVGVFVSGLISDKFGRKKALLITFVVAFLAGIGQTFSPNYETFVVLLFFTVIGNSAMYPVIYVLGVELVGPSKREMAATIIAWFFTFGEVYVAVLAWGLQNWIHMQLLVSCPVIIFLSYYWFVPESIRWLLSKGEHEQACEIIKRAAKINGVTLSPDLLKEDPKSKATSQDEHRRSGILQIFKSQRLLLRALNLFIIWIVNSFVYYGLSTNSTSLGGNKYMNFILVSLVEIPGYSFAWFAMNKFGRRISLSASMFICGASCIGAAFIPEGTTWATVLLFLVGKFGITSSFSIIYVFTTELYPTEMRNSGVGTSSMVARIGSILAPFLNILATYMKSLPLLIFAATSILAATLSLLLPETLGKKLPDSIQEAEDFGRKPSKEQSTELKDIPPNRSDQPNGLPA